MKRSQRIAGALIAGTLASSMLVSPVHAGPTVLRDDQLRDLAVTPVLGRGYSIATNTFQSICLTDFPKTKTSYNFKYKFEDIESDGTHKSNTSMGGSLEYSGGGWGISANIKVSGKKETIDNESYFNHYIVVTIGVDSYYSSIDESKAHISGPAGDLLKANDIPGFFDACGMYYTRSIGRHAEFVSLFDYKTKSKERDTSFEAKLEAEIKGWGQRVKVTGEYKSAVSDQANEKYLTIESTAQGLGKDEKASLIAYDLDTFRQAVKDAFVSMQQEDTGMVTSIEVVPWVENADFQATLKLGEAKQTSDGKTISAYAQKRILDNNGEFLAEVDRVIRGKLNVYYKAKQCRTRIDIDYKTDDAKDFRPEYKDSLVVNHRSGATSTLADLDAALTPDKVELLFQDYRTFLYGSGNDQTPGAVKCVGDLLDAGISIKSHREIDSCTKVEQQFAVLGSQKIDENCMPKLAPTPEPAQ